MRPIKSWRTPVPHRPLFGAAVDPFPTTRFFDQLSFIGTPNVACFLLETTQGIILLDCMEPLDEHRDLIVRGFDALGLDLKDLKAILITPGHTPGCLSFIFPVTDEGRPHMTALWGAPASPTK